VTECGATTTARGNETARNALRLRFLKIAGAPSQKLAAAQPTNLARRRPLLRSSTGRPRRPRLTASWPAATSTDDISANRGDGTRACGDAGAEAEKETALAGGREKLKGLLAGRA